jgi:branched-chain amino acid transport system substrate-binding protein
MLSRARLRLAALALVLLPISLPADDATNQPRIVIGVLLPPEEAEAVSLRQGVELGVDEANKAPGAKASVLVRGRVGQWGTDGEEAGHMVLNEGARGLIAPPGGAPSHLALQVSGRTATPVISLCSDTSVTTAGIPWMVRLVPSTEEEAQLIFSSFKEAKPGHSFRWAALVPEERAGREAAKDLHKAAQRTESPLSEPVRIASKMGDLSKVLAPVIAGQPDGVLLWQDPAFAGLLAKSLRTAGYKGMLAGPSHLRSASFVSAAGDAATGCVMPSPVLDSASQRALAGFSAEYRRHYADEPDLTACMAYDSAVLLIDVLRRSGDRPPHALFPLKGEWSGASGRLKFSPKGDRIVPLELLEFRSGRFVPFARQIAHQ